MTTISRKDLEIAGGTGQSAGRRGVDSQRERSGHRECSSRRGGVAVRRLGVGLPVAGARHMAASFLLLFALLAALSVGGDAFAQNAEDVRVTNHLFAERVIQTADGGYVVQEVIVGFERGRHSFETLTQVVLPRGDHNIEMAIADPEGKELERIKFGVLRAERDGWTMSLRGQWRDMQFHTGGMHVLVVYRNGQAVARFFLTVE